MNPYVNLLSAAYFQFDERVASRLPRGVRTNITQIAYLTKQMLLKGRNSEGKLDRSFPEGMSSRDVPRSAPSWLNAELDMIRRDVDETLPRPSELRPSTRHSRHPGSKRIGAAYARCLEVWPVEATHVVMVPWLKTGGADLVAIQHVAALASAPGNNVHVVATLPDASPWAAKLPTGVRFTCLGTHLRDLRIDDAVKVVCRLMVQHPPKVLHVISNLIGWRLLADHGEALSTRTRLFASSFCPDGLDDDGCEVGYGHSFLPPAAAHLAAVFSDNAAHPRRISERYGVPPDVFKVLRMPTAEPARCVHVSDTGAKVLWAGRHDRQKRMDILVGVAQSLPDVSFHVFGSPVLGGNPRIATALRKMPNVVMRGAYDGFESLMAEDWSCYLYTSAWDGLPNVLIEAGRRGMPVVASDVGGVSELVDDETGWLVGGDCPEAYAKAVRSATSDRNAALAKGDRLRRRVEHTHTRERFLADLDSVRGYVIPS